MDKQLYYSPSEIRTAMLLAAKEYPGAGPALLRVAFYLGLDVLGGDVMAGWPEGTTAPPLGGWRLDVPMREQ